MIIRNVAILSLALFLGFISNSFAVVESDCVFPNSQNVAPGWVCDEAIEGYEITAVGMGKAITPSTNPKNILPAFQSAILQSIVQITQRLDVYKKKLLKEHAEQTGANDFVSYESSNANVNKEITDYKFGENIAVASLIKQYAETSVDGTVDHVITSVSKLTMSKPCAYTMKSYIEVTGDGKDDAVDEASSEIGKQCTIKDVIKELSSIGLFVVNTASDSKGNQYVMLGVKNPILLIFHASIDNATENNAEKDRQLWERYKNSKDANNQEK